MHTFKLRHSLQVALPLVLLTLCSTAFGKFVDLEVVEEDGEFSLKIVANEAKCGNDLNCIQTTKGGQIVLDFRLKQACQNQGPQYKLTGMQFSLIQRQPDAAGQMKKAFGHYVIPSIVASDFDTDSKGEVLWKSAGYPNRKNQLSDSMIKLRNKNEGEYVVFFQIQAIPCGGGAPIYLDPRVENTGK